MSTGLKKDQISLEHIDDPKIRTSFFIKLIGNIKDYELYDVTDVFVHNPKNIADEDEEFEQNENNVHIDKASLKGQGVLQSPELEELDKKGFYISKIIWQAKRNEIDSDIYEFEAQFATPKSCTHFSYLPRGFYRYKNANEYNKSKTNFNNHDEKKISKLIESSAQETIDGILDELE